MARPKGSKNLSPAAAPDSIDYTTEQRLEFIATLIVERILADIADDQSLLKTIEAQDVRL